MEKTGRNDPCPCGSGLKFKKCHGSVLKPEEFSAARLPHGSLSPQATSARINVVGMPGEREQLHVINRFVPGDPRNSIPVSGATGLYKVTFVLGRPGYSQVPEGEHSFADGREGDSHLAITKPAFAPPGHEDADLLLVNGETDGGRFTFRGIPNRRGFLGKLISEPFSARSRQDAESRAFRALLPSLSNWSSHLDIPLEVVQVETVEMSTGNVQTSILVPYLEAPFSVVPQFVLSPEYRGLASIYREALVSNSPAYRFLCLYKVVEGVRARRTKLERDAKRKGTEYERPNEILPATDRDVVIWLNSLYPVHSEWDAMAVLASVPKEVRGLEISTVVEDKLKPLRDNIAHALGAPSGKLTQSADELLNLNEVSHWLPLCKCIARRMMKSDFPAEFLSYLRDDGTFVAAQ